MLEVHDCLVFWDIEFVCVGQVLDLYFDFVGGRALVLEAVFVLFHQFEDGSQQIEGVFYHFIVAFCVASSDILHDLFHDLVNSTFPHLQVEARSEIEVEFY